MLRCVALVRNDVSEELCASIIRVTRICELGTLTVSSNRRTLRRNTKEERKKEIQEPHGVTLQKTPFFIVTAVKTSNLTLYSTFFKSRTLGKVQNPFLRSVCRLLVAACVVPSAPIFVTLMKEAPGSSETSVLTRTTGVTTQKTPFFKYLCHLIFSYC
jgi:hypothetical protein